MQIYLGSYDCTFYDFTYCHNPCYDNNSSSCLYQFCYDILFKGFYYGEIWYIILLLILAILFIMNCIRICDSIKQIKKSQTNNFVKAIIVLDFCLFTYGIFCILYIVFNLLCFNIEAMTFFGDVKAVSYICSFMSIAYIFCLIIERYSTKLDITASRIYKILVLASSITFLIIFILGEFLFLLLFPILKTEKINIINTIFFIIQSILILVCGVCFALPIIKFIQLSNIIFSNNSSYKNEKTNALICGIIIAISIIIKFVYRIVYSKLLDLKFQFIHKDNPNSYYEMISVGYILISEIIPMISSMILISNTNSGKKGIQKSLYSG